MLDVSLKFKLPLEYDSVVFLKSFIPLIVFSNNIYY